VRFERFPDCGHGVFADVPERAFAILREFITSMANGDAISFYQRDETFDEVVQPCSLGLCRFG